MLDVRKLHRPSKPGAPAADDRRRCVGPAEQIVASPAWIPADDRVIKLGPATLLCSLDHEIEVVSL